MTASMKHLTWLPKAAVQLALSRLPGGERLNYRLQRHDSEAVRRARRSRILPLVEHIGTLEPHRRLDGATVVDVGAGWDLISSMIFSLFGCARVYALDHVAHARTAAVAQVVEALQEERAALAAASGIAEEVLRARLDAMAAADTLEELLDVARIRYLAPSALDALPLEDDSVDIVYTYAVLAHPPAEALASFAAECARVVRAGGIASHYIGLQDPFRELHRPPSNVSFLRYSERFWNTLVGNSINSNNRLRGVEHIALIEAAGGCAAQAIGHVHRADVERLGAFEPAPRFRGMTPEELAMVQLVLVVKFEPGCRSVPVELRWS